MMADERESIEAVCAKLAAIADHLEALDSESGEAKTFRMCATYLKQQQADIEALRAGLDKAHEVAEISERRIAEVYGYIVKARDCLRADDLTPACGVPSAAYAFVQDAFQALQTAKYGLGGRTNVAGAIAQIKRGER